MSRTLIRIGSTVAVLLLVIGCSDSRSTQSLADTRNEMEALTRSHYETSLQLGTPDAMKEETRNYAEAMNGLLDDMQDACDSLRHSQTMMGGYSWDDMEAAMGHMWDAVEEHRDRMERLDDIEAMHQECHVYRQSFMHDLEELDEAMRGHGQSGHEGRMGQ